MTEREQDLHEGYAVAGRRLLWIGLGLGVVMAGMVLLMYVFSRSLSTGISRDAVPLPTELPLQQHPRANLAAHQHRDAERLAHYAWLDREAGIARIPVRRAMEIMASQGQRPGDSAAAAAAPALGQGASDPRHAEATP